MLAQIVEDRVVLPRPVPEKPDRTAVARAEHLIDGVGNRTAGFDAMVHVVPDRFFDMTRDQVFNQSSLCNR